MEVHTLSGYVTLPLPFSNYDDLYYKIREILTTSNWSFSYSTGTQIIEFQHAEQYITLTIDKNIYLIQKYQIISILTRFMSVLSKFAKMD